MELPIMTMKEHLDGRGCPCRDIDPEITKPELFECQYDTSDGIICYSFHITTYPINGWVKCRMVHIHRQSIDGTITNVDYDPTVHDGTSHYMGHPYTARYNAKEKSLRIHRGDGTIFTAVVR